MSCLKLGCLQLGCRQNNAVGMYRLSLYVKEKPRSAVTKLLETLSPPFPTPKKF
jgi:hypothetical protein